MDGKKLSDDEIVKALEICAKDELCRECPYTLKGIDCGVGQRSENDYLDLIHRLQEENAGLLKENEELTISYHGVQNQAAKRIVELTTQVDKLTNEKAEQEAEIERLTEERQSLVTKLNQTDEAVDYWCDKFKAEKAEVKQLREEKEYLNGCAKQFLADYQKCEIERSELQKQVDELKAENNRYAELFGMVGKDFYTVEVGEWEKVKSGVKDMIQQAVKDTAREILKTIKLNGTLGYGGYVIHDSTIEQIEKRYGLEV